MATGENYTTILLADCITVSMVKDAMESIYSARLALQEWVGVIMLLCLLISGFGGAQEWFQTKMVHTRHNQSYACGIWCRDINSPAELQECNFFPHWNPKKQCTGACHLPSAHLDEDQC